MIRLAKSEKKRLYNVPENYRIFPDMQPAIIAEKVWDRVEELLATKRRPAKKAKRQVQRTPAAEDTACMELYRGSQSPQ